MHTRLERAQEVRLQDIDDRLAKGWYRVGQYWMNCRMLVNETGLRSTVWTRSRLAGYRFKRSHRKLLGRVARRFEVREGPAQLDATHEALYQRYLTRAKGSRPATLHDLMLGDCPDDAFSTRELSLWEGDRLMAFSWYDVGQDSMQSLIGVYDPDCARMSLGFVTVLLEMQEAVRRGLAYHYTGYVLPGDPSMDYKLRPGCIEFLDEVSGAWRPWAELDRSVLPAETVHAHLHALRDALQTHAIDARVMNYAPYGLQAECVRLLDEPLVLEVMATHRGGECLLVTWNLDQSHYRLLSASRAHARPRDPKTSDSSTIDVWVVLQQRATTQDVATLTELIVRECSRTRRLGD